MCRLYVAILMILMIEACGLKGPLYIPQDPPLEEAQKNQIEGKKN